MATKKYLDYDGVKYLWSKISNKTDSLVYEIVKISLSTNQGGGVTTTVTVTVDDKATDYEYNDSPITVKILGGKSYKISLGDYTHPTGVIFTKPVDNTTRQAFAGSTTELSYTYNACLLTVNGEGLSASVPYPNFTVTYDTVSKTVTNGGSILVPYTNVYVSAELEGYQVTNTSITADSASKSVTISFKEQQLGVFIYSHSGYELVPIDEYSDSVNDCHGIAICTPETSFVMAYDYWYHEGSRSPNFKDGDNGAWCGHNESSYGGNDYSIPNLPNYSGLYQADYETILNTVPERNGMKETDTIIKGLFGVTTSNSSGKYTVTGSPAAEFCKVYSGIPGFEQVDRGLWHMPNIVEMQAIINNKDEINRALTKLLGSSWMSDPGWWNYVSSTSANNKYYWGHHANVGYETLADQYRYYGACIIPCRPLYDTNWNPDDHIEIITFTINGDHYYFAEKGMTWIDWINSKYNVAKTTEQGLLGNHSLSAYQYNEQAGLYAKIQNGGGYLIIDENVNDEIYRWDFDASQVGSIPGKV